MSETDAAPIRPAYHHVGIQCEDLDNATRWYADFLGCSVAWTLTRFSPLTRRRLPGIKELRELVVGEVRLHLMERAGDRPSQSGTSRVEFQHLCLAVDSARDLRVLRKRWCRLECTGDYHFARTDPPTDIVVDDDGIESFYAYDVNGLELEFTWAPTTVTGR